MSGDLLTADGQMQLPALLLGTGTIYRISGMTGWDDLPGVDSGDLARPAADGSYPGTLYAQPRTFTTDITIVTDPAAYQAALAALCAATVLTSTEFPLAMQWGGRKLQANVRPTGRIVGADGYALGIEKVSLRWIATDPRRYAVTASAASCSPGGVTTGITWPITWPIVWPVGSSGGSFIAANAGDYPTPVVFTVTGPLTAPAIARQDTGQVLEFNVTLTASDVLVVDTGAGTATLNGALATRYLTDRSAPISSFLLPAGTVGILLLAAVTDPTAVLSATWRSAWL